MFIPCINVYLVFVFSFVYISAECPSTATTRAPSYTTSHNLHCISITSRCYDPESWFCVQHYKNTTPLVSRLSSLSPQPRPLSHRVRLYEPTPNKPITRYVTTNLEPPCPFFLSRQPAHTVDIFNTILLIFPVVFLSLLHPVTGSTKTPVLSCVLRTVTCVSSRHQPYSSFRISLNPHQSHLLYLYLCRS